MTVIKIVIPITLVSNFVECTWDFASSSLPVLLTGKTKSSPPILGGGAQSVEVCAAGSEQERQQEGGGPERW